MRRKREADAGSYDPLLLRLLFHQGVILGGRFFHLVIGEAFIPALFGLIRCGFFTSALGGFLHLLDGHRCFLRDESLGDEGFDQIHAGILGQGDGAVLLHRNTPNDVGHAGNPGVLGALAGQFLQFPDHFFAVFNENSVSHFLELLSASRLPF